MTFGNTIAPENTITISPHERAEMISALRDFQISRDLADLTSEELVECAVLFARKLPSKLVSAIHRMKNGAVRRDVLLVRGMIPADLPLERTPDSLEPGVRDDLTRLLEIGLLGVMSMFGEPFTFASLYGGRLVQDVVPVPGQEQAQTSGGSDSFLDWHAEDAFSADRCDHFGLFCLRGDKAARTQFTLAKDLQLAGRWWDVLRQERFAAMPDLAHGADPCEARVAVPVITGAGLDPEICYDSVYMEPFDPADDEAAEVLEMVKNAVIESRTEHVLAQGDLLILDNRRTVHARTPFQPRFDGTDRWLLRTMTCSSLAQHRRRGAARAIA